jgi:molecular chaperone GrpE
MAEERQDASAPQRAEPEVKVTDRRRFRPDGEPAHPDDAPPAPATGAVPDPAPDAREDTIAAQAARIDELTRAYAALVEDNKAFRQRLEREKARVLDAERAALAQALLEATDDLERALAAVTGAAEAGAEREAFGPLADGVRLSLGALHRRIAQLGAERIPVVGQPFDPHVAEAVDLVAVADAGQDGFVVQEVRAGWRIGDRVLRPARVRVGRIARA